MSHVRAIRDKVAQECYDRFNAFHSYAPSDLEEPYVRVAFALSTNGNPYSPLSGLAIYDCEVIRYTAKSITLTPLATVETVGKGRLPKFPYTYVPTKNTSMKIIGKKA